MIKAIYLLFGRSSICCILFSGLFLQKITAQTESDALMIPKDYFCAGGMFTHSNWKDYWEGTFKRDNGNIGNLTKNTYAFVANYGIADKLNLLISVPYVTTKSSAGTLKGQKGVQDLSLALKCLAFQTELGKSILSAFAIATGSVPLSDYEPDFLPMSIGLHSKSAAIRGLVNYQSGGLFIAGAGQYIRHGNITIDRDSYYTTRLIYSSTVNIPDVTNFILSTGYRSLRFNAEAIMMQSNTLGGFDIRKNDMPFPGNKMNFKTAGVLFKYSFDSRTGLELTAGGNYVLSGRNVGQATTFFGSLLYIFDFSKRISKSSN